MPKYSRPSHSLISQSVLSARNRYLLSSLISQPVNQSLLVLNLTCICGAREPSIATSGCMAPASAIASWFLRLPFAISWMAEAASAALACACCLQRGWDSSTSTPKSCTTAATKLGSGSVAAVAAEPAGGAGDASLSRGARCGGSGGGRIERWARGQPSPAKIDWIRDAVGEQIQKQIQIQICVSICTCIWGGAKGAPRYCGVV